MVNIRRKKVGKYRGHVTHGGGHRKKRRGAGSRGGRGNAGTGKRAGQKKAGMAPKLGKHGFTSHSSTVKGKATNVSYFTDKKLEKLLQTEKITKKGDVYVIDLNKLGYVKLLGAGNLDNKLEVTVLQHSKSALEKVKNAGGTIVGTETKTSAETKKAKVSKKAKE
jgi:large subunit ribosomal protein L15